ncbi:MAG: pyrimidine-nucleoside phosphorylase [Peptococcaceae bacterium]|jgi:pyrimidine-nucleoside phosphorylase|nr:pyrimidine-nucleoside phosphorylase [Peptococcaceae bacterium]
MKKDVRMVDLIEQKRDGKAHSRAEIRWLINGYTAGDIPDYQIAAWAMAVFFRGMTPEETVELTVAMAESGEMLDLSAIGRRCVDKHSTGGVGDKTTLLLGPMVAACGASVAKMSGRGLGHTGGTIDKLEGIPGFRVELSQTEFVEQVQRIGLALIAQSGNLTPADKKLYALRDVTATVNSLPLIASSVMSKKIAAGAQGIVLDVKYGAGAFMKTLAGARNLAAVMVNIGNSLQRKTTAVLSDMNQPLGRAVGNNLEVLEVIDALQGEGPEDLRTICLELGAWMLVNAETVADAAEGKERLRQVLADGSAWRKFLAFIEAQGGRLAAVTERKLEIAPLTAAFLAKETGYVQEVDAQKIGRLAMILGAGRETKESLIDYGAGLILTRKPGEWVEQGQPVLQLYTRDAQKLDQGLQLAAAIIRIGQEQPTLSPLIAEVVQ